MHRDFNGMLNGDVLNALENVADVDACVGPWAAGGDIKGFDACGAIDPNHAIVGKTETELRLKIYERGHTCSQCDDRQEGCGQLELEFLKHEAAVRDNTPPRGSARLAPRENCVSATRVAEFCVTYKQQ